MPCPRPQNREAKKEERKRMITQVVMLPRSCLQLEGPNGSTMVSTGIVRVSEMVPNRCWLWGRSFDFISTWSHKIREPVLILIPIVCNESKGMKELPAPHPQMQSDGSLLDLSWKPNQILGSLWFWNNWKQSLEVVKFWILFPKKNQN
jgi:hypothetical protein